MSPGGPSPSAGAASRAHLPAAPLRPLVGGVALGPERHAEVAEERTALLVGLGGRRDDDVQPPDLVHAVVVDLGEEGRLADAEGEVAPPVEAVRVDAAEVPDARERDR